jgi:hypothetical protein
MRAAALAALLAALALQAEEAAGPLPLRRIAISPDRVPEVMKSAGGALVRIPRAELEKLLRDAARADEARRSPPRLIEARYRASLADGALSGSLEWKIRHESEGAALLRLADTPAGFGLALRRPMLESGEALIADFPLPGGGTAPAVWIEGKGGHTVTAEWSARADSRPDGVQVELRLPPCPASSLEVELPEDASLTVVDGPAVSGPHPTEKPDRRLWRVAAASRESLPLLIRRSIPGRPVTLLARQKTTQRLSPEGLEASFSLTLESLGQDVRELALEHDPSLRPSEVLGAEVERWESRPGTPPLLAVRLRRPLREMSLEVKALAPVFADGPREEARKWASPWIRVRGAVPRGEQLEIHLLPGLEASAFDPGDYQIVETAAEGAGRRLSLLGGGLSTEGKVRRPSLSVRSAPVTFHVRQLTSWRLGLDGSEVTSRLAYRVLQGRVYDLAVALPAGWEAVSAEASPPGLLRGWGVRPGNVLIAELSRPAEAEVGLTLRLQPAKGGPLTGRDLPLPDLAPLGARYREGGLGISHDEQDLRARLKSEAQPGIPPADGPWADGSPEIYLPFAGQPPSGSLRLEALPPVVRGRAEVTVRASGGEACQEARLTLEAASGRPTSASVFLTGGEEGWSWRGEPGFRVERDLGREAAARLAGLASRSPLEALAFAAGGSSGSYWRLSLGRAASPGKPVVVRASGRLPRVGGRAGAVWRVPLPTVLGGARMEGDVSIHLAAGEQASAEAAGLAEAPGRGRLAWRSYRYAEAAPYLALRLRGPARAAGASVESARLVSQLYPGGTIRHRFSFTLSGWGRSRIPVQLPPGSILLQSSADGRWVDATLSADGEARIPVPARDGAVRLVIEYERKAPPGPWPTLDAEPPALPVRPLALSRLWLLPPGVRPMFDGSASPLPGTGAWPGERIRHPADILRLGAMLPLPGRPESQAVSRARAINEASAALRVSPAGLPSSIEDLVERLAFTHLGPEHPLVVDGAALQGSLVPAEGPEPWRELGLALLPGRSAVLLTSVEMASAWGGAVPEDVERAVAQAVAGGRDSTGRMLTALEWLIWPGPADDLRDAEAALGQGWTAWRPLAGEGPALAAVHQQVVTGLGALLALVVLGGLVVGPFSRGSARLRWLVGSLAVSGMGVAWLPGGLISLAQWPLLAGLGLAAPVLLSLPGKPRKGAPSTAGPRAVAAAVVLLAAALWRDGASARPEEPDTVYLIEGEGALLTPALHDRLKAQARAVATPASVALSAARYEVKAVGSAAEVEAAFTVHALRDGKVQAELPLEGVLLVGDVMVDGARALPRALPGAKGGYAVPLAGKGRHEVRLRFRAPITGSGDVSGARQVRFSAPRAWQSSLTFEAPAGATHVHVLGRGGSLSSRGKSVEVELGALPGPVDLRWHQEGKAAQPARASFRESWLWELRADGSLLTGALRYTLSRGVQVLEIDVPPGLEVLSAQARRPRGTAAETPVRLTQWATADGKLRMELPGPTAGEVEVKVELIPRGPLAGEALPLPRPHGEASEPGSLAYRAPTLDVARVGVVGLTGVKPQEGQDYAGTFRRTTPPLLRVEARPKATPFDVAQRARWAVGPRSAELDATLRVTGPEPPAALALDLGEVQGVLVTSVEGAGVGAWAQAGRSLLVWLDRKPATQLRIKAWAPVAAGKPPRFDLPCLRPVTASKVVTEVALVPEQGSMLVPQAVSQLAPSPRGPLEYDARSRAHGGTFQVRSAPEPRSRVRTTASVDGGGLAFESKVELKAPAGARTVQVRLRGWPGPAELVASEGSVRAQHESFRRGPARAERLWRLDLGPSPGPMVLTVRGRMPAEEAGASLPMPDVTAGSSESFLTVGPGLATEGGEGLQAVGERAWRVASPGWSLRLSPRQAPRAPEAEVLLREVRASMPDGRDWLHEVTWHLKPGGVTELHVKLPASAELASLEAEGAAVPARVEQGGVWVSLASSARPRVVRARYRLPEEREPLWRPDLTPPELEGVAGGPTAWCVVPPEGWEVSAPAALPPEVGRPALELYRSRAGGGSARLAGLALAGSAAWHLGPASQDLKQWHRGDGDWPEKRWPGESGAVWISPDGGKAPSVRLSRLGGSRQEQAAAATLQWALLWVAVWVIGVTSWLRAASRALWPEMALVGGLAAWWALGPWPVPVGLAVFGLMARSALLLPGSWVTKSQ